MRMRCLRWLRWLCLPAAVLLCLLGASPLSITAIYAQDATPTPLPGPPTPHLGYGIHIAPNTNLDVSLVNALGVDWVKIYDLAQTKLFPDKHVLYRLDLRWPDDWNAFKIAVATQARTLASLHIDAVEVGNEPNLVNEWSRGPNAWEYVQMLRVAYTSIKSANPNIIVVSAGLAPTLTTA